jgi:hypothetical protein
MALHADERGALPAGVNGPAGLVAVATPMAWRPFSRDQAV